MLFKEPSTLLTDLKMVKYDKGQRFDEDNMRKIVGWVLLILGVLIIIWGIYCSYEIFTAKKPSYEIFKTPEAEEVSLKQEKEGLEVQAQEQMQEVIKEQFEKMLPSGFLPKLFNLIAWSIFMGILVFAAGKLSILGIKLLKT